MRFRPVAAFCFFVCAASTSAVADDWRAARCYVAGAEQTVWIVGESKQTGADLPVIQFWCAGQKGKEAAPKQLHRLPPVSGEILALGADAKFLRVLFSNLSAWDYSQDDGPTAGARWRDVSENPPLAWGGSSRSAKLWAVVHQRDLKTPTATTTAASQGSRSASAAGGAKTGASDRNQTPRQTPNLTDAPITLPGQANKPTGLTDQPDQPTNRTDRTNRLTDASDPTDPTGDNGLVVMELDDGAWRRLQAPPAAAEGEAFWITGWQERPWLFWRVEGKDGLLAAQRTERGWTRPQSVPVSQPIRHAWVGARQEGPVLVVGVASADGRVQLHVYAHEDGGWVSKGAARDGTEKLQIDPQTCGVGIGRGGLAVARPRADGTAEFGFGVIEMSPLVQFTTLAPHSEPPPASSDWQDAVSLALVLGLMTFIMWTRREQVTRPAILPVGFALASVWRRALATIVDALPALVITMPFAASVVPSTVQAFDVTAFEETLADPQMQSKLLPIQLGFLGIYGVWCLVWELVLASTPGKLLLGCRVLSLSGSRPTAVQSLWRNALRVLMVGLGPPGWIVTLMMMVLVTRNRQRLGDVMAGTIVVMPEAAKPPEPFP